METVAACGKALRTGPRIVPLTCASHQARVVAIPELVRGQIHDPSPNLCPGMPSLSSLCVGNKEATANPIEIHDQLQKEERTQLAAPLWKSIEER